MSNNRLPPGLRELLAITILAAALDPKNAPKNDRGMPPDLREFLGKPCDCPDCNPGTGEAKNTDRAEGSAEQASAGQANSNERPVFSDRVTEVAPDVVALVGMDAPDFDPNTPAGRTRVLAAAFISNVRALGEQPESGFAAAGAKLAGMRYAESQMLAALQTFVQLSK